MNPLWLLTKKNLKLLIRSKSSALIVIFAPLLIILILGLSFNNSAKYGINIGVYSSSYTEDVNSFIKMLQEDEFKIVVYNASIDECIEDIKLGAVHTCISLPESFQIEGNAQKAITFYVDPSKINLVWMVQQTMEKKLNLKAQEISQNLAQDMLTRMQDAKGKIAAELGDTATAKDKSSSAAAGTDNAKTLLSALDLAGPTNAYDLNLSENFKMNLSTILNESLAKVTAARNGVDGTNLSGMEKSLVKNNMALAATGLDNALALLENNNTGYAAVSNLISSLNVDLASAKDKLSLAATAVATTKTNLDGVRASLTESLATLDHIQNVLGEAKANLEAQKVTEAGVVSSPLSVKIEKVSPEKTYLNYMFPALIVLVIMFSSLLLGTTLVMMEKNSPAYHRNFFLPIRKVTFILSTYLTNLILIVIQLIIILGISLLFIKDAYLQLPLVSLVLFLAATVFTFLGMALGYIFISEETGVLASISLGSILLFISGIILPLESVSPLVRNITFFNPFVIAEKLVREIFIFGSPFTVIWMDLLLLFAYAVVLFLIILIVESFFHQHLVNRFLRHHHKAHREKQKRDSKTA